MSGVSVAMGPIKQMMVFTGDLPGIALVYDQVCREGLYGLAESLDLTVCPVDTSLRRRFLDDRR
jgi:hypothetical protein